jgi:NAD-dependent deacetylase
MKQKLVVLSGAGISAESGLKTFRDSDGLWEGYRVEDVATLAAWQADMPLVLDFYNMRRKNVLESEPNKAHILLKELEEKFDVQIITQNVDNLHERAGSTKILHLHGIITQAKSTYNDNLIYEINGWEMKMGDRCEYGSQLRPNIVWFGEAVPNIEPAIKLVEEADLMLVIGTSLQVYPAAGLVQYFSNTKPLYIIDPKKVPVTRQQNIHIIEAKASEGMEQLVQILAQ